MDQSTQTPVALASKKSKTPAIIGGILGIAALGALGAGCSNNTVTGTSSTTPAQDTNAQTPPPATDTSGSAPSPAPSASSGSYKDGTYSADGSYQSPAGSETVHVTLTLKGNVITDSQFQATGASPISQKKIDDFSANYKSMVVGQNVDAVNLTKVSGSSLTPQGFDDALAKIKAQASL